MSDLQKTVEIIFQGTDSISKTLKSISGKVDKFGSDLQNIGQPFADAAKSVVVLESALTAMVAGGFALAVTTAGNFSDGMAEINTLIDTSASEFSNLSAGLVKYSETSTASMDDLQSALYNMISLGVDYKSSLEAMNSVEQLSVAAKADMTTTTETLIGTMNAYGAEISSSSDYSDAFFTIIKDGKTTLPELSQSIANVTSIAATAGIPFETLGAAVAALTASGAPTSEAITKIKSAISALVAPTESAKKAAESYGVEIGASALESEGFEGVLKKLYDATDGNIDKMKEIIPRIDGVSAAVTLGADSAGVFAKALLDMGNNTGATEKAFEKMKDNLSLTWQTMENNFNAILIKIGLSLEDSSTDLISGFTNLFQAISDGFDSGDFDSIINGIKGFLDELASSLNSAADNLPEVLSKLDFESLIKSYDDMKQAISDMFGGIDLGSVEGLKEAIDFVISSIETLNSVTTAIIDVLSPMAEGVKTAAEWFNDLDTGSKTLVGDLLGLGTGLTAIGAIVAVGGTLLGGLGTLAGFFNPAGLLITGVSALAALLVGKSVSAFEAADKAAAESAQATDDLKASLEGLPEETKAKISAELDSGNFDEANKLIAEITDEDWEASIKADVDDDKLVDFGKDLNDLPEETTTAITAAINQGDFDTVNKLLQGLTDEKTVEVTPEVKPEVLTGVVSKIDEALSAEAGHTVYIPVESKGVDAVKKDIEDIPTEKMLEIKLQGDIDKDIETIKTNAETVQTAMEWTAKVNIAEAEAAASQVTAAFEASSESVSALSDSVSSMFGSYINGVNDLSTSDKWHMEDLLKDQQDAQNKLVDAQTKLTKSQQEYIDAKTESLKNGDGTIKIDSSGLEPALEMVMWEILEKVHVRATEEQADFLLGL